MDSYTFALALGGAGLAAMAVLGVSHLGGHQNGAGHAGHAGHSTHAGHAGHDTPVVLLPHAHATHASHASPPTARLVTREGARGLLLSLASPRTLFSVILGFGATGVLLRPFIGGIVLAAAAVAGGVLFEGAVVRPLWNALFRFASAPAASLEGSLMSEATASSGFDADGHGLVAVEVDGQLMQCLGTLRPEDRALGIRVRAGDRLRVEDVDARRSRCTVSYIAHGTGDGVA